MPSSSRHECLVLGAGPSGLGSAASLLERGVDVTVLERGPCRADAWTTRYDCLRLNTSSWFSHLPGQRIPRQAGRWPSATEMWCYYDQYAAKRKIPIRTGVTAERLTPDADGWQVDTSAGQLLADTVIVATGKQNRPVQPDWTGRDEFDGTLIHSSEYRDSADYVGLPALVIGSGNSGMDIAVDLSAASDAPVWLSVRRPPHIMPHEIFGLPHDILGISSRHSPRRLVDASSKLLRRVLIGDLAPFGLPVPDDGIVGRLLDEGQVPTVDKGAFRAAVRSRRVEVVAAVERFAEQQVVLADGSTLAPKLVVAATGYRPELEPLVGHLGLLTNDGLPVVNGPETHPDFPGLFFVGYVDPLSGHLREQRLQAEAVGKLFRRRRTYPSLGLGAEAPGTQP